MSDVAGTLMKTYRDVRAAAYLIERYGRGLDCRPLKPGRKTRLGKYPDIASASGVGNTQGTAFSMAANIKSLAWWAHSPDRAYSATNLMFLCGYVG